MPERGERIAYLHEHFLRLVAKVGELTLDGDHLLFHQTAELALHALK